MLPSPSELRHKYNVRFARRTRCRSTATLSSRATPQVQHELCKEDEVQVDCYPLLPSHATNTKSYRVESKPPARGLSCSPVLA